MSDIFREVDEDVRRDQLTTLWKRYGIQAIAVIGAVLLAAAAWVFWQHMQEEGRRAEAAKFLAATRADDAPAALKGVIPDLSEGYAALARMRAAAAMTDPSESAKAFDAIAGDGAVARDLRDLAAIRALIARADLISAGELQQQAAALASGSSPYRFTALELQAVAEMALDQLDNARRTVETIIGDQKAPPSLRERAGVLLAAINARSPS